MIIESRISERLLCFGFGSCVGLADELGGKFAFRLGVRRRLAVGLVREGVFHIWSTNGLEDGVRVAGENGNSKAVEIV